MRQTATERNLEDDVCSYEDNLHNLNHSPTWFATPILVQEAIPTWPTGINRMHHLKIEIPVWILEKEIKLNILPLPLLVHKHIFFLPFSYRN